MIKLSPANFTLPIFALALASLLPSQALAECTGANYDIGTDNYTDDGIAHSMVCDNTDLGLGDPNIADAFNVIGDAVDDAIQIGNAGNAFNMSANVNSQGGNDTITIQDGSTVGSVLGGDGLDTITVSLGSIVNNSVLGGNDKDTITITNIGTTVANLLGEAGDDSILVDLGAAVDFISGGDDKDGITIDGTGTAVATIFADAGDDTLLVQGGTVGTVQMGFGADVVEINNNGTGDGVINGNVVMDAGDDRFIANGGLIGNVNIAMNDGNDETQLLAPAQADFQFVQFDGGDGIDTFIAFNYLKAGVGQVDQVGNYEILDLQNSTLRLLGPAYQFDSNVSVDAASTLEFGDNNLSLTTGQFNNFGTLDVTGGGTGKFSITVANDFANTAGLIDMSDGFDGDELTITGNYVGGGTIDLDVFIGGTGSPADKLSISGNGFITNATGLNVIPSGFDPQLTGTGPGNGIALVDVTAGTTDGDDFFLSNGPINAGAFVYDLVLETDNIWYLQSRLDEIFQAFAGGVTAAQQQGEMVQGTLHQRMGDLRHEEEKHPSEHALQLWMRGFGGGTSVDNDTGRFTVNGGRATSFDGGFDTVTYGGQGGADYGFADLFTGQDRLHLGVMGYYGHTDVDFGVLPVTTDVDGYGGGVYATYIHPNFYVDTSVLAGKLDFRTTDHQRGTTDKYDGDTIGASIETGVPITLGQFVIEPQLQLTYRDVRFDSFETDTGVRVSSDDGESLKGRAGARFAVNLNPTEGFLLSPYVTASVVQEFMGDNTVDADAVRVHSDVKGTSFDGGLGVTASFGNAVSIFAEAGGTVGDDVDSARGNLGVRVSW